MKGISVEVRISYGGRTYEVSEEDFYSTSEQVVRHVQNTLLGVIGDIKRLENKA